MALSLPSLFIAKLIRLQNDQDKKEFDHSLEKTSKKCEKFKWYKGKSLKEMPVYLFWPAEKRYSKVLYWGYGYSGLHFIEDGYQYRCAADNVIFLPAEEKDYLQFMKGNLNELTENGKRASMENPTNFIRTAG